MLELVADGQVHTLAEVREELADKLDITPQEREMRTASAGKPIYRDRMDWARTDLVQAGLLEASGQGRIVITPAGRQALATGPADFDRVFLKQFPQFEAFLTHRLRNQDQAADGNWTEQRQDLLTAAFAFRDRCLIEGRGLLLPSRDVWTTETIEAVFHNLIETPNLGPGTFAEKLQGQLRTLDEGAHALAADAIALYLLYPSEFLTQTKRNQVRQPLVWAGLEPEDFAIVDRAFAEPIGSAGMFYIQRRDLQLGFYLAFALAARSSVDNLEDPDVLQRVADEVAIPHLVSSATEAVSARTVSGARNILLCLLAPHAFEPIASTNHKNKIAQHWAVLGGDSPDLDQRLRDIRKALSETYGDGFSYYSPAIKAEWQGGPGGVPPPPPKVMVTGSGSTMVKETLSLQALADHVHMGVEDLERLEALLETKKQVIIEGPPGSGKTYLAESFAAYFASADDRITLIQFHQSYGYEDFIQGIRPRTDGGAISYARVDGIFKRFCDRARSADKSSRFVFIIDEINRGNVARIFGELMYCLEYRDRAVALAGDDIGADVFAIPQNVYLIGTMNNTDRSLAQLDYALRRRFYFYRLEPVVGGRAPILESWLSAQAIAESERIAICELFVRLNTRVTEILGPDFQVGHSYFMQAAVDSAQWREALWASAITPLLEEYLHNRADREPLIRELQPDRLLPTVAIEGMGPIPPGA